MREALAFTLFVLILSMSSALLETGHADVALVGFGAAWVIARYCLRGDEAL